jgi:hypothetical protein
MLQVQPAFGEGWIINKNQSEMRIKELQSS